MKKHYLFLAFLCLTSLTKAQLTVSASATNSNVCLGNSSTLTAVASPIGYSVTAIPTNPAAPPGINVLAQNGAIGSTPLSFGNLDDGRWDNISLPFTFRFYGNIFNSINVCTNGWVGLGSTNSTATGLNVAIPNAAAPNNVIHAITSDLTFGGGPTNTSMLEYFQDGFPPNRRFIINFGNVKFFSAANTANVQIILYETTNAIEIHTSDCSNITVLKSQGIENSTGLVGSASPGRNNVVNWGVISSSYSYSPDNVTYTWSPGATLYTTTGGTVIATPAVNTIYTINAVNTTSGQSASNTVTVNINAASFILAAAAGGPPICQNISVSPGGTYYRDGNCNLIATLTPAGGSPLSNSVNTCTRIDTGATKRGTPDLYGARKYDIDPIFNPATSSANVTVYYLQSEFNDFNRKAADSGHYALPSGPADAAAISHLRINQYHGTGTNPTDYTGGLEIFSTATAGFTVTWNATRSWWEVTVPVTGFSGFYLTSEKLAPMPVTLQFFTGSQNEKKNILNWKVVSIGSDVQFSVERSADGSDFNSIGNIAADEQRCSLPFVFTDNMPLTGKNYYRIRITDRDGKIKYSNILLLTQKKGAFELLSINPNIISQDQTELRVNAAKKTEMSIIITDNAGRRVQVTKNTLAAGFNVIRINVGGFAAGVYQLTCLAQGEEPQTLPFIKN